MSSTISEPFLLSSYNVLKNTPKDPISGEQKPGIFAEHGQSSSSSDGYVTVAAHGDGVHVLDISTLHPVASHTLGPATTFSCPAVTRTTLQGGSNISTTYAVIHSAPGIDREECGRTVWMWKENVLGDMQRDSQKKHTALVPHVVSRIYAPEELPTRVLLVSPEADITVASADLEVETTFNPPEGEKCTLLKSFVFSGKLCTFAPSHTPSQGAIVLLLFADGKYIYVSVIAVGNEDGTVVNLGSIQVPFRKHLSGQDVADMSCSASGYLTILEKHSGFWHSFQVEPKDQTSIRVFPISEPTRLSGLWFTSDNIATLSLGSSHVLISGITMTPKPEITLLVLDLQYSVLLAEHTLPLPSTLPSPSEHTCPISLDLISTNASQALLILSPHLVPKEKWTSSYRGTVLVVPYTAPPTSTIANAMGRATAGAKWLAVSTSTSTLNDGQTKVLRSMRTAMTQNRPETVRDAFFLWYEDEEVSTGSKPSLGNNFVRQILNVLIPNSTSGEICSPEILHHLLSIGVVSDNMVEGGLLNAVRAKSDWESIPLIMDKVLDISEVDIISLLQMVVARHRQHNATIPDGNAMQVDENTSNDFPSLPNFLARCVSLNTSPAMLRLAIRKHMREAEDLVCVLEVLESWMSFWSAKDVKLMPDSTSMNTGNQSDPPPLLKVLSFLQTVLDSSFLTLLQHTPSHSLLQKICSDLELELALVGQMEQLRVPLEPFAKAHARVLREGPGAKKKAADPDSRKKKADMRAEVGLAVGQYRLEELVI